MKMELNNTSEDKFQDINKQIIYAEKRLQNARSNLRMIAASTPKDMFPEDEQGSTLEKFSFAIDIAIKELEDANTELLKLKYK